MYQGWSNYATWLVATHLSNEETSYGTVGAMAEDARNVDHLATDIQDYVEKLVRLYNPVRHTLATDMLQSVIDDVDWYEIAAAYMDD